MRCIYCLRPTTLKEPVEHVIPEGLVGNQLFSDNSRARSENPFVRLILDHGQVCGLCNNKLSSLDAYLQEQVGFLKVYWNPIGTKKGNAATAVRPGMFAERRLDGPFIGLSSEAHPVTTENGKVIPSSGKKSDAVRVTDFQIEGQSARLRIEMPIRINKRFMRALHKIGFELLCFQQGHEYVLNDCYEPLRSYIRYGRGSRRMVMSTFGEMGSWEQLSFMLQPLPGRNVWLAVLQMGATFYMDLSPKNSLHESSGALIWV